MDIPLRAQNVMAFISACTERVQGLVLSQYGYSHGGSFGKGPLYPEDIIRFSFTIIHPTPNREHPALWAISSHIDM